MKIVRVVVDERAIGGFIRRAKKNFPKEHIELMWGKVRKGVAKIYFFRSLEYKSTSNYVEYEDAEFEAQRYEAKENGYILLGTIHSHPNSQDSTPSLLDWRESIDSKEIVSGICAIWKKNGRKHASINFWPPVSPCHKIIKSKK